MIMRNMKSRIKTFKPDHQRMVDAGQRGSWALMRVMSPAGAAYATHITADMYTDYKQLFTQNTNNIYTNRCTTTKLMQMV
jgi:hypothetical protein